MSYIGEVYLYVSPVAFLEYQIFPNYKDFTGEYDGCR